MLSHPLGWLLMFSKQFQIKDVFEILTPETLDTRILLNQFIWPLIVLFFSSAIIRFVNNLYIIKFPKRFTRGSKKKLIAPTDRLTIRISRPKSLIFFQ